MSSPLEKPAAVLHSADAPSTRSSDHKAINQKQISRYAAELNRTLSSLESTSRQDWATQSSILSQLTKVLDSHRSVVGSVPLPDPLRFCRALWGALDPQSVLGVQRKALDVLSRYVEYAVAMPLDDSSTSSVSHDPLTEDFPYLLIGVMELFPLCSLQVKPDLLQFIEHLIRALPPQQVRMCLFGVLSTVLQAMEEAEGSGVFRRASSLLRYIREKVSRLTAVVKNDSHFHDGKEGRSVSPPPPIPTTATSAAAVTAPMARGGGEAFFANLWVILRDCPGLRGATLVFLKAILAEEEENLLSRGTYIKRQTNGVDGEECQEEDAENSFQGYTGALEEELDARRLEWLGGPNGAHSLVHPAFLLCLQDRSGKTQRLALDLLVAYFPLECHPADSEAYGPTKVYLSSAFSFHDMSLLVVAALQLLGLPGETTGVLRRIAAWLCGPHPESTDQYIEQTTGFIISHSFYGVKQWWQRRFFNKSVGDLSPSARCLSRSDGLQSSAALTVEAKETDYTLDALYTSGSNALSIALDQFHRGVMGPTACDSRVLLLARAERTLLDHEMPAYIWWCAMLRLLQHTMAADHNDDDVNVSMDASSTPQSGSCGGVSRPFMAHVAPLIATNFFEWLVCLSAMQSSHLIQGMQESPLDAIIGNVFVELPWPLITQYETGLLTLIHKVAALVANSCDENHSPPSSPTGVAGVASHDNWDEIQHQAELWLSQLHGFTEVLLIHVMAHARSAPERAVPFFSDTFDVCRLLAKISLKAATGLCSLTASAQQPLSLAALEGKELSYRLVEGPLQLFRLQCSGVLSGLHDRLAASTEAVSAAHISDASLAGRLESEVLVPYFIPMSLMLLKSATGSSSSTETLPILLEAFGEVFKTCCEVILLADQLRTRGRCGVDHGDVQEQHSPKRDQLASWLTEIATSIPTASPEAAVAMLPLVLRVRGLTGCPSALKTLIENETIMVPIVHSMWDLSNSGAVSADLKFAAVQLLLDLIDIDTGKKALDALMLRNSSENCERIIDVMNHLAHRRGLDTAHSVLFTGYCTLLASLVDASSPAHNMSVQYFARRAPSDLLSPILNSFLQGTDISDVASLHIKKKPSSKGELMNLHQRDGRNPVYSFIEADELVRYVSALLLLPSAQEWVEAAGSTPAPADMATLLQKLAETSTSFSNSPTAAAKNRDAEDGIPSKALLGVLAGALFLVLRQSIISFQATSACAKEENQSNNNSLTEAPNLFSPLVCLNKLVEYTPPDSAASMPTWRYTSVRCVPLLQIAVELEMVTSQILLLAHLQVTTQFLSVSGHGRLQSAAMLATLPNASEYVNRPCPHALSLPSLYRTIEEGVCRCVDNPSGIVRVDLLRSWANFLVDLLPVLGKQLVSASHTIIHVLLHVCENTRQQQLIAPSPNNSFSINDAAHAKIQSLCDLSLHRVLVYVYAVAGVVDAANSAFAQKTLNQMGWFSTFSSNAEDTSNERSLWQRSAICEPCRKLLTRLVLHSIPAMGAPLEIRPTASQLMQLLHKQAGLELVNTFVTVWEKRWAASEVCIRGQRPSRNLRLRSTSAAAAAATPLREDVRGQQNVAASTDALEHHSTEGAAMLLVQSTGATFLTIARAVDRLLLQSAATISDVTAASSTPASRVRSAASPSGSAPLPRETLYLYFLHQLMAAHRDKLKSEDIGVMMDIFSRLLTAGAPCYLSMASMYRSMHLMHSIAPSEFQGLFVDKRFTFIICRTLECLGSIPIYNSPDPDNHLFAIEIVSSLTPCFIPSLNALDGNQRVVDAVALLFTRTAFPTLRFGIESSSESDVISRTPSVITILRMILFIVKFSDTVARRVRGDLLELCLSEWFFRFPSTALHEWAVLWERLTHDRGFLSMSREKFSAPSNKLASIMTSFETEALQRSRQLKCLAFSTLAMPAAAAGDRDYITFIKEQVSTVLEVYSSSAIPTIGDLNNHKVMLQPVRMVLLLVRILLTKVNDALLSSFWPIIVPEMMRAMQMQYAADMLAGERSEVESGLSKREQRKQRMNTILDVRTQLEVFALQAEVLKLIDFAVTICPDRFTTFRWLFSDDTRKCGGSHVDSGWTPFFVPMMEGAADVSAHANTQELKRGGQKNPCPLAQERIAPVDDKISPGFTRPFLRIPETHYRRFSGIGVLVAALAQHYDFMKDPDVRTCFAHHHRRNDYWDKSYVRSLLLADLSLVDPDTSL